jgi:hypothetical protein
MEYSNSTSSLSAAPARAALTRRSSYSAEFASYDDLLADAEIDSPRCTDHPEDAPTSAMSSLMMYQAINGCARLELRVGSSRLPRS